MEGRNNTNNSYNTLFGNIDENGIREGSLEWFGNLSNEELKN